MYVTMDHYSEHGHVSGKNLTWCKSDATGGKWLPRCPLDGALCTIYAADAW